MPLFAAVCLFTVFALVFYVVARRKGRIHCGGCADACTCARDEEPAAGEREELRGPPAR